MKKYHVMTLFPEMIMDGLNTSILGRAIDKGILDIDAVNIRDFTNDKHNHVDDYPYGGGAGMVMQPQPIYDAYQSIVNGKDNKPRVIYLTPQGKVFNQKIARELSNEDELVFLCGHYEGVDERVLELIVTDNISIGDYVLTGGEIASMAMIDAISRLVPGVLNNQDSYVDESFSDNLLEYPQYTRPPVYMDKKVPDVLLSGNHAEISKWRKEQSVNRTAQRRPDLFKTNEHSRKTIELLTSEMIKYNYGDPKRIQHAIKVHELSTLIGKMENLPSGEIYILESAAILHDIGIRICEKKYGKCNGKLQEKEGPAVARKILKRLSYDDNIAERILYLIAHHHTYDNIMGMDYQILVEADFLVNMYEDSLDKDAIIKSYKNIFKTSAGKMLCRNMYGIDE